MNETRTAPCGLLSLNEDARIVEANETLLSWLSHTKESLVGERVDVILSPGARIYYQTHLFPMLRLNRHVDEIYLSMTTAAGEDVPVLVNASARDSQDGPRYDCAVIAIRRRSRFEDEILQSKKAAEEASRAKGKFLSMISHDLRSPLSTIVMTTDILASGASGLVTEAQLRDLEVIKASGNYVLDLIRDMLHFSRLESGRLELKVQNLAVRDLLERADALARHQIEAAGLSYESRLDEVVDLVVRADRDRLLQILLNLLTNAAKFTDPGGRVSVRCERDQSFVRIRVEDDGVGIPEDQHERIFAPFVQVESDGDGGARKGVGLGLSISRELARVMSGDVTLTSGPGKGSVFTITMPAAEKDSGA